MSCREAEENLGEGHEVRKSETTLAWTYASCIIYVHPVLKAAAQ